MVETRLAFVFRQLTRKLWVRAVAFAVLGVALVPLSRLTGTWLPESLRELTRADAVEGILNILASSMLAVTTFSLSIMVAAYAGATASVTPRAVALLLQDRTSQTVLSTFIGAFLFSMVGIIALEAGAFGPPGVVMLFLATVAVIALVVVALIRWIDHLTQFGRLGDTTDRVETATARALTARGTRPALGGVPTGADAPPHGWRPLTATETGYLCHIDMPRLKTLTEGALLNRSGALLQLACLPGSFLHPGSALLWMPPEMTDAMQAPLRAAFSIEKQRTFDQDPRFGLCVLSEIAERALSPAVNDPGTAIDVLGRAVRLLGAWQRAEPVEPDYPRILVPALRLPDLFGDIFPAISRDGATHYSVHMRLQKALLALAQISPADFGPEALAQSARALEDARRAQTHGTELENLAAVARQIEAAVGHPERPPRAL